MISYRNWWSWMKPGYITMTQRQSNNQWSGGIVAYPPPPPPPPPSQKKFLVQKSTGKVLTSIFWDQDGILLIDYPLPKGQTINAEYYSSLLVQLKDSLKEKRRGKVTKGVLFLHDSVLITHPILQIWPSRTTTCSLDWKNNWKVAIFRPTRRSLLPQRPGWTDNFLHFFFWVAHKS